MSAPPKWHRHSCLCELKTVSETALMQFFRFNSLFAVWCEAISWVVIGLRELEGSGRLLGVTLAVLTRIPLAVMNQTRNHARWSAHD